MRVPALLVFAAPLVHRTQFYVGVSVSKCQRLCGNKKRNTLSVNSIHDVAQARSYVASTEDACAEKGKFSVYGAQPKDSLFQNYL
jgi:hypothetical protein